MGKEAWPQYKDQYQSRGPKLEPGSSVAYAGPFQGKIESLFDRSLVPILATMEQGGC
jgi:hypothetical protein